MTGGLKDSPGFYIHHSPQIPLPLISPFDVLVPVQVSRAERVVRDHEEQDRRTGSAGGNDHSGYFGFGLFLAAQEKDSPAQTFDCQSTHFQGSFLPVSPWRSMGKEGELLVGTHLDCVL